MIAFRFILFQRCVQISLIQTLLFLARRFDRDESKIGPAVFAKRDVDIAKLIETENAEPYMVAGLFLRKIALQKRLARTVTIDGHDLVAGIQSLLIGR